MLHELHEEEEDEKRKRVGQRKFLTYGLPILLVTIIMALCLVSFIALDDEDIISK